jgi:hypothetical protein
VVGARTARDAHRLVALGFCDLRDLSVGDTKLTLANRPLRVDESRAKGKNIPFSTLPERHPAVMSLIVV